MSPVNPAATSDPGAIAKAMTTPRFAALARADLSVRQIGTWDADLPRDTRLLVPIDVQASDWECRVEPDGRVRLGLMYVNGLRQESGRAIAGAGEPQAAIRGRQCPTRSATSTATGG